VVSLFFQVTLEPVTTVKVAGEKPELVIEMVVPPELPLLLLLLEQDMKMIAVNNMSKVPIKYFLVFIIIHFNLEISYLK
jgi:hypothetical protein